MLFFLPALAHPCFRRLLFRPVTQGARVPRVNVRRSEEECPPVNDRIYAASVLALRRGRSAADYFRDGAEFRGS